MSKTKRIVSALIVLCLTLALMAGCGNNTASSETTAATAAAGDTTAAGETQKALDPYNIVWLMPENYSDQTEIQLVAEEANKITREKFNATIEIRMMPFTDYIQKMPIFTQSGEKFDVCLSANWASDFRLMASREAIVPMGDLLEQYGQVMKRDLPEYLWDGVKWNGEVYAIPTYKDLGAPVAMLINKKLADKYSFDFSNVKKFEDMEPFFQTLKEKEPSDLTIYFPGITPALDTIIPSEPISANIPAAIRTDNVDYKVQSLYEMPDFKDYGLKLMRKWYDAGYIKKDYLTAGEPDGPTGKWFARYIQLPAFGEVYQGQAWNMELSLVKFGTSSGYGKGVGCVFFDGIAASCMSISSTSADPARAMMFLNLLNTDKTYHNIIVKGVENRHYKTVSDGVIDTAAMEHQWGLVEFTWGNIFLNYLIPSDPINKWEIYMKDNDEALKSPLIGFSFDPEPVKTEIAAVNNVTEEFRKPLFSGSVDPDEYAPKAIAKYKDAGLDRVIAEMQKQVDAWRAAQ